jgi:ABC-type transporter Mla subunit MlaD
MAGYNVATEDLDAVQQQLDVQLNDLATSLSEVDAAGTQMQQQIMSSLDTAVHQVTAGHQELAALLTASQSTADAAHWTGPDSEQFRAGTAELLQTIRTVSERMLDALEQHRAATTALHSELEQAEADFAQAAGSSQESTGRLRDAVRAENESYEAAFNGSFGFAGGAPA